jgi:uncharacterized SAM-binding protein YcdF (DUF218 family)
MASLLLLSTSMELFAKLLSIILLFPTNLLLLAAAGLLLQRYQRRAIGLTWLALGLLLLLSTRSGSLLLSTPLETRYPPLREIPATAQAIVVLGGNRRSHAPEYGGLDVPSYSTLTRLQYAARLYRQSHLPILVSGGTPIENAGAGVESEAEIMARSLHDDFNVPTQWLERLSPTTAENATRSAAILSQSGIKRIILVTDAVHMPRALASFRHAGLQATPAATVFYSSERRTFFDFIPSGEGMRRSNYAIHEWIGMLWYIIRNSY